MRRSRMLIAALCFLLALPLQVTDFITTGGLFPFWKLVSFALMGIGVLVISREARRAKSGTTPPK